MRDTMLGPAIAKLWQRDTCRRRSGYMLRLFSMLQDTFQLHWPLINSDHMRYKLAQRELEQKKIEDGNR